jgi:hypothetical protein
VKETIEEEMIIGRQDDAEIETKNMREDLETGQKEVENKAEIEKEIEKEIDIEKEKLNRKNRFKY